VFSPGSNDIYLSVASAWEISIKYSIGKLELAEPPDVYLPSRLELFRIRTLNISLAHAAHVSILPRLHKDPFDRLLVAQAQIEDLPVITGDPHIAAYGVEVIW
jgi:PIN domain nuclease of toxin-antitoxin system